MGQVALPNKMDEQHRKIDCEQKLYQAQHEELLKVYHGQYIAMDNGRVVDHDVDRAALGRRIRACYGNHAIFITPVLKEAMQTIYVRSTHLVERRLNKPDLQVELLAG